MKPIDSTVRMPHDLLERAEKLSPENRSEILREACTRGLEEMEKEKVLDSVSDTEKLVAALIAKDPTLNEKISKEVRKLLPSISTVSIGNGKVSFYRKDEFDAKKRMSVFRLKRGEAVELIVPAMNWMIYTTEDLSIHSSNPDAKVRVSKLCSDGGNGRDLLNPGWHLPHEFGGIATDLVKQERMISPNDLRMLITSDEDTLAVVSLVIQVQRDDSFGPVDDRRMQIGRKVRIPFEIERRENASASHSTKIVNWGVLRVLGIVFEGSRESLFSTVFEELKIGGSPTLTMNSFGWDSAVEFTDLKFGLRANPILISPNQAHVDLRSLNDEIEVASPYLVCDVLRDDGFFRE